MKLYEVYVCMPELGSPVHNVLEGADYVINENQRYVLSGTKGEVWATDMRSLSKTYVMMDGSAITEDIFTNKTQKVNGKSVVDWFKIQTKQGSGPQNYALFVPKEYMVKVYTSLGDVLLANRPDVSHGKGDFIVCSVAPNGEPNLNDMWVLNGEVFPYTYVMTGFRGFANNLDAHETPKPKSIIPANANTTQMKLSEKLARKLGNMLSNYYKLPVTLNDYDDDDTHIINIGGSKYGILVQHDKGVWNFHLIAEIDGDMEECGSLRYTGNIDLKRIATDIVKSYSKM